MKLELIVIDNNAPSDKYTQWGFSIDFKDADGNKYYAEYPNYKSCPYEFDNNKKYSLECSIKTEIGFLSTKIHKISRIKNIIEIIK